MPYNKAPLEMAKPVLISNFCIKTPFSATITVCKTNFLRQRIFHKVYIHSYSVLTYIIFCNKKYTSILDCLTSFLVAWSVARSSSDIKDHSAKL